MKHFYYVTFIYDFHDSGRNFGHGSAEIRLDGPITTMADILEIGAVIARKDGFKSVVIQNFILLRTE